MAKKSMKLGGGGRFAKGSAAIQKREGLSKASADAIMAKAGREKYGNARMASMSAAGRKRASKKG